MNTFGNRLRLTTFGESHGKAVGGIIDGFPSRITVDFDLIGHRIDERKPGKKAVSSRNESDLPVILSGINEEGITLGTPIGFLFRNTDIRSDDYRVLSDKYRPNHADFTYQVKYGIRDYRGGGRASARETVCRVFAGALAEQFLRMKGIAVNVWLEEVGGKKGNIEELKGEVEKVKLEKDSIGGTVCCEITGLPAGIGNPVYDKISARLAYAMMSINAVKGFEIGDGFELSRKKGSEVIDAFYFRNRKIETASNHCGGVLGGITTGMPLTFRVAFKPTPTIGKKIPLLTEKGEKCEDKIAGRHDPCVAIRGMSVVRAMACLVAADYLV